MSLVIETIFVLVLMAIVITLIKAHYYKAPKPAATLMPDERVDEERIQRHLSEAIQIKTISNPDDSKVDWSEFARFHAYLENEFPLTHKTLKKERISQASLLYTWEGTNPDLEPIALLAPLSWRSTPLSCSPVRWTSTRSSRPSRLS